VVDLDSAEGLRTRASRKPSLITIIIKHHSGPAGTHDCLTAEKGEQGEGPVTFSIWCPGRFQGTVTELEE
jgi:hypothetical protein